MAVTARQLNRATLARQLLLRRESLDAAEAVRRVFAVQAQEAASPYVALWNRVAGFDPAGLDAAFADHTVLKASLMRMTLHAVHAADHPPLHAAMRGALRANRLADPRFTALGLTREEAEAVIPAVLEFTARPRGNAEVEAMLDGLIGARPKPGLWWALRTYLPVVHAPTGGAWSFGARPAYLTAPGGPVAVDGPEGARWMVRRYLEAFGPATLADIAQFARLARVTIRTALAGLTLCQLEAEDGTVLYDVPGGEIPPGDTPAPPRLLAMWDSVLLAYADRARIIPPAHRPLIIRTNGDTLPTVLVDGRVAGVWRPAAGGIEVTAFDPLTGDDWAGLAVEAAALTAFLADRNPTAYRRYARWWDTLPPGDTRVIPG